MSNVEDQIRRAMQAGQFDNLPGAGRPLRLEDDPFEDPEWHLAHHVLRSSGFTLPWIEARRELEAALQATRQALKRSWDWRQAALVGGQPAALVEAEWRRAVEAFCQKLDELNRDILTYNLKTPSNRFHLSRLNAEREIELTTTSASDKL
jgi:DnaJ family protein C protein 28